MGGYTLGHLIVQFAGQRSLGGGPQVFVQVCRIAGADDGGVTVRMRQCIPQYQLGSMHPGREDFIQPGSCPDIIQRGPLDFGVRATVGNAAPDDDSRPGLGGQTHQFPVLGRQTGVWQLKSVEHAKIDQGG